MILRRLGGAAHDRFSPLCYCPFILHSGRSIRAICGVLTWPEAPAFSNRAKAAPIWKDLSAPFGFGEQWPALMRRSQVRRSFVFQPVLMWGSIATLSFEVSGRIPELAIATLAISL